MIRESTGRGTGLGRNLLSLLVLLLVPPAALALGVWLARDSLGGVLGLLVDPRVLVGVVVGCGVLLLAWWAALRVVQRRTRPRGAGAPTRWASRSAAALTALAMAVPLAYAGWSAWVTRQTIRAVVPSERSATAPDLTDDWGGRERFNVLLLGGDGGVGRTGIRTDSVMVLSIDVRTGETVGFGLPRNLRDVPFPPGSALAEAYPDGFRSADGEEGNSLLNAIYPIVPQEHPGILGPTDNDGADAVKQGVSAALGIPVDHYVLVNLRGFREIVDAIGGITVNVNQPIPIGGDTDRGIPPRDYLDPGPDRRLDGFEALWYARGRYGLTDYDRIERQRCAIAAIVEEADPGTLLTRYTALAASARSIVRTDVPQELLPAVTRLALRMKAHPLRSVVFTRSATFDPNDPDYDRMRAVVRRALDPPARTPRPSASASASDSPSPSASPSASPSDGPSDGATGDAEEARTAEDACAYAPVEGTGAPAASPSP